MEKYSEFTKSSVNVKSEMPTKGEEIIWKWRK
jgi:hypothetical protein